MTQLEYVLTGIKQVSSDRHLSITRFCRACSTSRREIIRNAMLWAAACTGFFGFLREREFTVPSEAQYDPKVHLSLTDISVDSHSAPSMFGIQVKQTLFEYTQECTFTWERPIIISAQYWQNRSSEPGPLFMWQLGKPLTTSRRP